MRNIATSWVYYEICKGQRGSLPLCQFMTVPHLGFTSVNFLGMHKVRHCIYSQNQLGFWSNETKTHALTKKKFLLWNCITLRLLRCTMKFIILRDSIIMIIFMFQLFVCALIWTLYLLNFFSNHCWPTGTRSINKSPIFALPYAQHYRQVCFQGVCNYFNVLHSMHSKTKCGRKKFAVRVMWWLLGMDVQNKK